MEAWEPEVWRARAAAHRERVERWTVPYLRRRERGEAHPVEDFLFTYYSYRPGRLVQWHPGADVVLLGARDYGRDYRDTPDGAVLDTAALLERRRASVEWIGRLLAATASRPAHLGCFGLHEWAMVYRTPHVRHEAWPLRLTPDEVAAVVDERGVRCSHFDAFRFFTDAARPLNVLQPSRDTQYDLEQPGCLHANMDLYKWAYKLSPLIPSDLVADCFALARDIRAVDMRASPYDLAALGYPPIRIETASGRAEYAAEQRAFTVRAAPLRQRLQSACEALLN
ncbi:3-methyladenine DNA glycosylase [Actinomadura rayongensis]|uniref:3-methyladenine DNA glycosylase n=1 Tax=Actinomadura rayongensis TaxID=1429076 RepID=A0A6I4W390_9ACTN|nr:3-methyladenine DNA glycosylase [Actinomadura rayongensis]